MLQAALHYARHGLPVFPCNPRNKAPLVPGGFHAATKSPKVIKDWWAKWPKAFIGMPTGAVSGVDVLDIDYDEKKGKNGFKTIPDWQKLSEVVVATPRGGRHFWFRSEGKVGCTTSIIGPDVDTRGDGGYVILPPSKGYRFDAGSELSLDDLRPFPPQLRLRLPVSSEHRVGEQIVADIELLSLAFEVIPNDDLGWHEWNTKGLALFAASAGSDQGFKVWDEWSKKSSKYDVRVTTERWRYFGRSPPNSIGAGSICYWANQTCKVWRKEYDDKIALQALDVEFELYVSSRMAAETGSTEEFMRGIRCQKPMT